VRILVAEDDPVSRLLLEANLKKWGHEPVKSVMQPQIGEMKRGHGPR
jgi:CheY-like chemotaxis protein